jgi:hypothetical protein
MIFLEVASGLMIDNVRWIVIKLLLNFATL